MLLMFPAAYFMAENRILKKSGEGSAVTAAMLPYVFLVIWFAVNNSNR